MDKSLTPVARFFLQHVSTPFNNVVKHCQLLFSPTESIGFIYYGKTSFYLERVQILDLQTKKNLNLTNLLYFFLVDLAVSWWTST